MHRTRGIVEREAAKPRLGHLKKHDVAPHKKLVEIRGPHELAPGETVTVEVPGQEFKARATPLTGADYDRTWAEIQRQYPFFTEHQQRAGRTSLRFSAMRRWSSRPTST